MLPRENRLKNRQDFSAIYAKGSYCAIYGGLAIKYLSNNQQATLIGFPIGKNFSKKAVVRNRARRVLRAATAELLTKIKPGFNIVILLRPDYQNLDLPVVIADLDKVFRKANLFI